MGQFTLSVLLCVTKRGQTLAFYGSGFDTPVLQMEENLTN